MKHTTEYVLVALIGVGIAYAVATLAAHAISDSLGQSAALIDRATHHAG